MSRTVFRVFLSSTFGDFQLEREALRARVWPELERLCAAHGASFQVIDLRWGIAESAAVNHDTVRICLDEVKRCQRLSPKPNFVILGGDRYGWRPTPTTIIPVEEFTAILGQCRDDKIATALLKRWYRLDRNALPPVYALQPRTGEFLDGARWATEEQKLLAVLRSAAKKLGLTPERRELYFLSATHLEIVDGLLRSEEARGHVFAYQRTITGLPKQAPAGIARRFSDYLTDGTPDPEAAELRRELFDEITAILPKRHLHRFKSQWTGEGEQPLTTNHVDVFCARVHTDLLSVIKPQLAQGQEREPLALELEGQAQFQQDEAPRLVGRDREVRVITAHAARVLAAGKAKPPLLVSGPGGSGKSALLARAIEELKTAHPEALLIYRFIGVTPRSWEPASFLEDLLTEVCRGYGEEPPALPEEGGLKALAELVAEKFALASAEKPLLLVIDAVDQFGGTARPADLFPSELPPHVALILSVLDGRDRDNLARHYPKAKLLPLQPLAAKAGAAMLDGLLARESRTLRPSQRAAVLNHAHGLPLYVALAAPLALRLTDRDEPPELPETVTELAAYVVNRIAAHHGEAITRAALHYLKAARYGLSEEELQAVLWRDPEVRAEFERRRNPDQPTVDALPPVFWARLYGELDPYINEVWMDGQLLHRFFHRVFGEVAGRMDDERRRTLHSRLADFYLAQPLYLDNLPDSNLTPSFAGQERTPNGRRLMELPYHLAHAGRTAEAEIILTDFNFAMAKCRLNRSDDWLITMQLLEDVAEHILSPSFSAWKVFADESGALLRRGNNTWPAHKILLQLAREQADGTVLSSASEDWLLVGGCDWIWLKRVDTAKLNEQPVFCRDIYYSDEAGIGHYEDNVKCLWSSKLSKNFIFYEYYGQYELFDIEEGTFRLIHKFKRREDKNEIIRILSENQIDETFNEIVNKINPTSIVIGKYWNIDVPSAESGYRVLELFNTSTNQYIELRGHDDAIAGVIKVNENILVTWGWDATIRLWDVSRISLDSVGLDVMHPQTYHTETPNRTLYVSGTNILFSWVFAPRLDDYGYDEDSKLIVWDTETGNSLECIRCYLYSPSTIAICPSRQLLAFQSHNYKNLISYADGKMCVSTEEEGQFISSLLNDKGTTLLTGLQDKGCEWRICYREPRDVNYKYVGLELSNCNVVSAPNLKADSTPTYHSHENYSVVQALYDGRYVAISKGGGVRILNKIVGFLSV